MRSRCRGRPRTCSRSSPVCSVSYSLADDDLSSALITDRAARSQGFQRFRPGRYLPLIVRAGSFAVQLFAAHFFPGRNRLLSPQTKRPQRRWSSRIGAAGGMTVAGANSPPLHRVRRTAPSVHRLRSCRRIAIPTGSRSRQYLAIKPCESASFFGKAAVVFEPFQWRPDLLSTWGIASLGD